VDDVIYSIESISSEKNIKLLNKVEPNLNVYGDVDMLKLVLRNILTNSIKFSCLNSSIEITSSINSSQYILAIKDNGIGMTPEDLNALFLFKNYQNPVPKMKVEQELD
jgi:signal transduction histidine kinase